MEGDNNFSDADSIIQPLNMTSQSDPEHSTEKRGHDKVNIYEKIKNRAREEARSCCSFDNLKRKFPIIVWLPKYSLLDAQSDLIAGITVGLTVIPQGLAYARVANLPPQYGLYSAFLASFTYIFMGTSKDITMGPTALMSLMTASFAQGKPEYATILCLFCGIIQFLMGALNLGFLVSFISYPVINGFTTAAAIIIAFGQVKDLLGLENIPREFTERIHETFHSIPETNVWDLALGSTSLVILLLMKKMKEIKWKDTDPKNVDLVTRIIRKIIWVVGTARNAVVVVLTTVLLGVLQYNNIHKLTRTGEITDGLPKFMVPTFTPTINNQTISTGQLFGDIGAGLAIVPLLGILENIAIAKAFARRNNYKINPSQEMLAIGVGNLVSCFATAYPVTGSFSRTAVNSQSGVRTTLGGLYTGVIVLIALGLLTPLFAYIPKASLAAVIIAAVLQMIDFKIFRILWKVNKIDLIPLIITLITSFVIGIEFGIMIGVGLSILMLLRPTARPKIQVVEPTDPEMIVPHTDILVESGLYFPSVEYFYDQVLEKTNDIINANESSLTSIVIDCQRLTNLDYTTIQAVKQVQFDLKSQGKVMILRNLKRPLRKMLQRAGLEDFLHEPAANATHMNEKSYTDKEIIVIVEDAYNANHASTKL